MSEKKRKSERDILLSMLVTLDVSHFEISVALNPSAFKNAIQKKQKDKKLQKKEKERE